MFKLCLIFALTSIVSCSTLTIGAGENIKVSLSDVEGHKTKVEVPVEIDFFLWGIVPKDYSLNLDKELMKQGYLSVANVSVKDNPKFFDFLYTVVTLGFYMPKSYIIEGKINPYQVNNF